MFEFQTDICILGNFFTFFIYKQHVYIKMLSEKTIFN